MGMLDDPFDFFNNISRGHKVKEDEIERLKADSPRKVNVGDRVLVAIGLIGYGFEWLRQECEVTGVADTAVKVKWKDQYSKDQFYEKWVINALVTDIISRATNE